MTPEDILTFENGFSARIFHDPDCEQPFAHDDTVRIVVLHRRYIDPSGGDCGRDPDEVAAWECENAQDWFTIPLYLYDHSGTIYRTGYGNPFHCPWDSGRVGIIALKRSEWGKGTESDETLAGFAQAIAAEYSAWANGDCYGYVLCDAADRECDSCWGFIGIETVREQAQLAAIA